MPRKRDGFVPLGDVAEAVELPGESPAQPSHFTRLDQVTQLVERERRGPRRWLSGPHNGVVFAAAHQPRQPASVHPAQWAVHVGDARRG